MATRQFDFIVGPETSTLPTIGIPSSDDDLISLGYADDRYTQGGESCADITALKAVASAERRDGDLFLVKSTNNLYRFDSASSATGDDNFVLTPAVGTGRWLRVTILNRANTFTDTTQSTDKDTGGAIFEGGVGIEKNLNVGGNVIVTGNMTVNGTTTTVNSATLDIVDANITVNKGGSVATADSAVSGITVDTDTTDARIGYDSSLASKFKAGNVGSESEVMTVGTAQTVTGVKTVADGSLKLSGATSGASTLKAPAIASTYVHTLPDATDTLVGKATADVFTNKTYDAAGTGNVLSNVANTHISASAAIAYSKLNLTTSIVNGDIAVAAAVDRSKLATGSTDHVIINSGAGVLSSEAQLAITRGGTGQSTAGNAFNALAPTTTKGDLIAFSTTNTRVPVGTNGFVLTADSSAATGVAWAGAPGATSLVTTDATAGSGAGSVTVLTGTTSFAPNLTISTGDTYTINTGGSLISVNKIIVNGSLIINGTAQII